MLKNLVVIGQGAPNQLKDGRQSRCVCAYSLDDKILIRLYPFPIYMLRKWDIFDAEVEKNPTDHRENTWKIKNSKEDWKKIHKWVTIKGEYPKDKQEDLIKSIGFSTLSEIRDNKKSFGIILPIIKDFKLEQQNKSTIKQMTLGNVEDLDVPYTIINQKDYKYKPYVTYECVGDCKCKDKTHCQSITEWGCFEFMRKNVGKEINLKDNLQLFNDEYSKYILIGNIYIAPQTYVIIDILRFKKKKNEISNK